MSWRNILNQQIASNTIIINLTDNYRTFLVWYLDSNNTVRWIKTERKHGQEEKQGK